MKTTMATLRNQAKQAPKYILSMLGCGYLADEQTLSSVNFTSDIDKAMQFSVGFDNPQMKVGIWSALSKLRLGTTQKFEIVNL